MKYKLQEYSVYCFPQDESDDDEEKDWLKPGEEEKEDKEEEDGAEGSKDGAKNMKVKDKKLKSKYVFFLMF